MLIKGILSDVSIETMENTTELSMSPMENTSEIFMTTEDLVDPVENLYIAYNVLAVIIVCFTMLAMGSGISLCHVKSHVKKPVGPVIGILCQFIFMPLLAFAAAHVIHAEDNIAIGMIVVASCPGGAPSNMFTFWTRGDLSLSVTMTACSCVLALLFMPLNIFLYTTSWKAEEYIIPYKVIILGILMTWIPIGLGMLIRKKSQEFADKFIRVGSVLAFILLVLNSIIQKVAYEDLLDSPWYVYLTAFVIPLLGFCMGFGISLLAKLPIFQCRTIGFETGVQNVGLALAMIALSFPGPESSQISMFPIYYLAFSGVGSMIIVFVHRVYFRYSDQGKLLSKPCCTLVHKTDSVSQITGLSGTPVNSQLQEMTSVDSIAFAHANPNQDIVNSALSLNQSETISHCDQNEAQQM